MSAFSMLKSRLAVMALVLPLAGCSLPGLLWPFGEKTETPDPLPAPDQMPADTEPAMAAPVPPVTEVPQVRPVPPAGMTPRTVSKTASRTTPSPDTDTETVQPRLQQPQSRVIAPSVPEQAVPEQAGYHVQLASYRRQAEAERGWRRLQTAYPAVLGAHHPHIRRADIPEQGVFYRLSVRGFEDIGQSVSLCDALISAGGDCIVKEPDYTILQ